MTRIVYVNGRRTVRQVSRGERILALAHAGVPAKGTAPNGIRILVGGAR